MSAVIDDVARELRPPPRAEAAVGEPDRCLECGGAHAPAPCTVACPASIDAAGFVAAIAAGDPAAAAQTIFAESILGGNRLNYLPQRVPVEEWLGSQQRFAYLFRHENAGLVRRIQEKIDADWAALLAQCNEGPA